MDLDILVGAYPPKIVFGKCTVADAVPLEAA
jgi:hypothetical protein